MTVYSIEEWWGDDGGWKLIKVTSSPGEARDYDFDEDYKVTEWEVEV